MPFVADDLGAWLVGLLADAGRKKLTALALGSEQQWALRKAATAAVQSSAVELRPDDAEQASQLARVVDQVFTAPVPGVPLAGDVTMLEELSAGIAGQLAVLDDASLTGKGQSSAAVEGLTAAAMAETLTGQLIREIVVRGSRGGPLEPLAAQLNHDVNHLQGQRLEGMVGQLANEVRDALARLDTSQPAGVKHSLPLLLVAAGDHPDRLRSEAAWAHLCAVAPIPASSGKTARRRLNPAGDRQANHALSRIVITRMSSYPPTRAYGAPPRACRRR